MAAKETSTIMTIIKNASFIPAFLFGIPMDALLVLGFLMLADICFGVLRAGVIHGGRAIKSYKIIAGLVTKFSVLSVPIILALAGEGVGVQLTQIAEGAIFILILAETYSILGNIYAIHKKQDIEEWDAVSAILEMIRGTIERLIRTKVPGNDK